MTKRRPHPVAARIRLYVDERRLADPKYSTRKLSADALGNPTQLSGILRRLDEGAHISSELLIALAVAMETSLSVLMGEERPTGPRLRELHGWDEAVRGAREALPMVPTDIFDATVAKVGEVIAPSPPVMTRDLLVQLVIGWSRQ